MKPRFLSNDGYRAMALASVLLVLGPFAVCAAGPPSVQPGVNNPCALDSKPPASLPTSGERGTWAKTYGGSYNDDECRLLKENGDGSFFFSAYTTPAWGGQDLWLSKVDSDGFPLWQKSFGSESPDVYDNGFIATVPGGGFAVFVTGSGQQPLTLLRLDGSGEILWQKSYGAAQDTFSGGIVLPDGGFLLSGATWAMSPTKVGTVRLMKLDPGGNIVWQKKYTSPSRTLLKVVPIALENGNFLANLTSMEIDFVQRPMLLMLDPNGDILWQRAYDPPAGIASGTFTLDADGGYLFAGVFNTGSHTGYGRDDILLAKTDTSGSILWQKTYGGDKDDAASAYPVDGGYLLVGWTYSSAGRGTSIGLLCKVDGSGGLQWSKTYGGPLEDSFESLVEESGGFVVQGYTSSYTSEPEALGFWAVKVNGSGEVLWQKVYGGSGNSYGSLYRKEGGGLLLAGSTESAGAGQRDLWIWSLNAQGGLGFSCPLLQNTTAAATSFPFVEGAGTLVASASDVQDTPGSYSATPGTIVQGAPAFVPQGVCSGIPVLEATASAEPTVGPAPLEVHFTGEAMGGYPPYTYSWNFADGSPPSTEQNPVHIFTSAGTFSCYLTVTDSHQSVAGMGVAVYVTGVCALACDATVPTAAAVGVPVTFLGYYNASECPPEPTFAWTFGDGTEPALGLYPSHTYTSPGSFPWTFTVNLGGTTCSDQGTIVVGTTKPGDCNGDDTVSIGEVQKAINMFLGIAPVECGVDCNGDGTVSIGEVQKVINGFLGLAVSC